VIGALRTDYADDPEIRSITDAVVTELAFLGRLDVSLERRGVLAPPRGMRWWWEHLGGVVHAVPDGSPAPSAAGHGSAPTDHVPVQLRLVDILSGYGDGVSDPTTTAARSDA
jgi:hypothetical protein